MTSHKVKLCYAVSLAIAELVRTSEGCIFAGFTFADCILDKAEAAHRWRNLKARLKRRYPDLRGVGVWERHPGSGPHHGVWHLHYVFDRRIPVDWLRESAIECGFGPQLNLRRIGAVGVPGAFGDGHAGPCTARGVGRYVSKYLQKDLDTVDKGVRLVDYCGDARKATTGFSWSKGLSFLWRRGRKVFDQVLAEATGERHSGTEWSEEAQAYKRSNSDEAWGYARVKSNGEYSLTLSREAYWFVLRLGWESLDEFDRQRLLEGSEGVKRWWMECFHPERIPF